MYELFLLYASALLLGLVFCALPDAINTEALRREIKGGFRPAFLLLLGSCIGDLVWAVIALIGLTYLVQNHLIHTALGIFGGLLLFYLAYKAFIDAYMVKIDKSNDEKEIGGFFAGSLISLCNPFEIVFWLGIGGSYISIIAPNPNAADYLVFLAGYMTGSFVWCFVFAGVVAYGRRFLSQRIFRGIYLVCGAFLVLFALAILWATLTS